MANQSTETLSREVAALKAELESVKAAAYEAVDCHHVRKLQHIYGYYLDKCLYEQVVDLFHEDCTVIFHGGIFKGKEGAKRLFIDRFRNAFTNGRNGPVHGFLLDHFQLQDVIDISPDRKFAKSRLRCFMQAGSHISQPKDRVSQQWWEHGIYENEYIRDEESGIWKIWKLHYRPQYHADYEKGWAHTQPLYVPFLSKKFPEDPSGPDDLVPQETNHMWPDTDVVPFHYAHPITEKQVTEKEMSAPVKT